MASRQHRHPVTVSPCRWETCSRPGAGAEWYSQDRSSLEHTHPGGGRRLAAKLIARCRQQRRVLLGGPLASARPDEHVEVRELRGWKRVLALDDEQRRAGTSRATAGTQDLDRRLVFPVVQHRLEEV